MQLGRSKLLQGGVVKVYILHVVSREGLGGHAPPGGGGGGGGGVV